MTYGRYALPHLGRTAIRPTVLVLIPPWQNHRLQAHGANRRLAENLAEIVDLWPRAARDRLAMHGIAPRPVARMTPELAAIARGVSVRPRDPLPAPAESCPRRLPYRAVPRSNQPLRLSLLI